VKICDVRFLRVKPSSDSCWLREVTSLYAPALPGVQRNGRLGAIERSCLVDGTFWRDNELISAGVGSKTARAIGHVPLSGAGGLLEEFGSEKRGRRVLIHINNTNPILDEDGPEHGEVRDAGWEIAYDGMESIYNFDMKDSLLPESDFIAGFHAIGEERYHHKHHSSSDA